MILRFDCIRPLSCYKIIGMNKILLKDSLVWGFTLWLIGYILSMILFFIVPPSYIGWIIAPVGTAITIWVLLKKVKIRRTGQYFVLGIVWTLLAFVLDYFLIVKALNPADGYYKPAVYLYYTLTFALPIVVGQIKK